MLRKSFGYAMGAMLALAGTAGAQDWPTRPVTMVIPFAAGGPTDVLGRVMAERMSQILGQQVYIDVTGVNQANGLTLTFVIDSSLGPDPSNITMARYDTDGTFVFPSFPLGTYQLMASIPANLEPGWRVKSAMQGDVDLLDTPLIVGGNENIADVVVTLVRSRSEISGGIS